MTTAALDKTLRVSLGLRGKGARERAQTRPRAAEAAGAAGPGAPRAPGLWGGSAPPSASLRLGPAGCGEDAQPAGAGSYSSVEARATGSSSAGPRDPLRPCRGLAHLLQGQPFGCHGSGSCLLTHPSLAGTATSGRRCGERGGAPWLSSFPSSRPFTLGGHNPGERSLSPAGGDGRTQPPESLFVLGFAGGPADQGPRLRFGVCPAGGGGQAVTKVLVTPGCYCKQSCEPKLPRGRCDR